MRFSPLSVLVFLVAAAGIQAETWTPYPSGLPQFDYQGERLAQFWPQLMMGPARPFPTADYLQDYFRRYPAVLSRTRELAAAADAGEHTALPSPTRVQARLCGRWPPGWPS